MKIAKCTFEKDRYSDDPSFDFNLDLALENQSDFDIELITYSVMVAGKSGVVVGGDSGEDDSVFISAKSSGTHEIRCNATEIAIGGIGLDAKCYVSVNLYKREFVKIGSLDFPQSPGDYTELKGSFSLGGSGELMGVSCLRLKDDEDNGECVVDLKAGVRNTTHSYIARAQMSVRLLDQREALIEDNWDYTSLAAKAMYTFNPGFYGLNPGKIKNAKFEITASVYVPVDTFTAEAVPTQAKD